MNTSSLKRWWLPIFLLVATVLEIGSILWQGAIPLSMLLPFFVPISTLIVALFVIWANYLQAKQNEEELVRRAHLLEIVKNASRYQLQGQPILLLVNILQHRFLIRAGDKVVWQQPQKNFDACIIPLDNPGLIEVVMSLDNGIDSLIVNILGGECVLAGHRDDPLLAKLASEFELTLAFQKCGFGYCISERK